MTSDLEKVKAALLASGELTDFCDICSARFVKVSGMGYEIYEITFDNDGKIGKGLVFVRDGKGSF